MTPDPFVDYRRAARRYDRGRAMEDIVLTSQQKTVPGGFQILRFDDYPSTTQAMLSGTA